MTNAYSVPPRRDLVTRVIRELDDFASWLLYGAETWLVALLKGVPLLLFMYFVLGYIPNYMYTVTTLYLGFSKDVGYLVAVVLVGGPTFTLILILALWTQAARGRRGFAWSLIRFLDIAQVNLLAYVWGTAPRTVKGRRIFYPQVGYR